MPIKDFPKSPNTSTTIVTSLVEHPEEWTLSEDPTYKFISHKKGFSLSYFNLSVEVWRPSWAKGFTFTHEERKMIRKAINLIVEERQQKNVGEHIIKLLDTTSKPWWRLW